MGAVSYLLDLIFLAGIIGGLFIISLVVALIIGFVIVRVCYNLKGTPQQNRDAEKWLRVLVAFLIAVILMAFIIPRQFKYSPPEAFQGITGMSMPRSVKVLHLKSWAGFDGEVWMHFTIDPKDFQPILAKIREKKFIDEHSDGFVQNFPTWWKPEILEAYSFYYYTPKSHGVSELYVNSTLTEAYGCYYYKYRID